ncbi:helix-turn-helix transcriptional regulator [uncultured Oscillibacter sp.]|uniref:helix-turn-helix transcriptional regulator n=1 Tax=uncultured Oscillibacter sp. TaxID=876091 RepID=UPI0025DF4D1B|nr:helix-turn-helix transcriptional regulator [uncultured Oscillibacter sp.]
MDKTSLGSTIAALRKERGMTQLDLARQLGITDKAVSKWERGLSCPDLYTFPRLAEILGASVEELMQVSPAPSEPAGRTAALLSLIFRAVVCAMGAAVTSLAVMGALDTRTGFSLLGIGLLSAGIALLRERSDSQ